MTTEHTGREAQHQPLQDQTGDLAESARRHLAYERLTRQIAASENAARLVLAALARIGPLAGDDAPEEDTHEPDDRP